MPLLEDRTASFVIKVWREGGESSPAWRGSIEQVETHERRFFRELSAVVEFMKPCLEAIGIDLGSSFWERMDETLAEPPAAAIADPAPAPPPVRRPGARRRTQ